MQIAILPEIDGAKSAQHTAVIIDVLRAATVASYLLDAGVTGIIPVSSQEEAFALQKANPDYLLVGENKGIQIEGFDIGNSPTQIVSLLKNGLSFSGKTAIHRSSTGTQGIVHATNAQEIIFGSFVSAQAIIDHLRFTQPESVTLVPMGTIEDQLCAEYLATSLMGEKTESIQKMKKQVEDNPWIQERFLNPNNQIFPEDDFHMCLTLDTFDFFPLSFDQKIVKNTIS